MNKLNTCWKNCLRMWKWVASESGESTYIGCLKTSWLVANGFSGIRGNCFFCHYDHTEGNGNCETCPAVLVDDNFRCWNKGYNYTANPKAFYAKLVELNNTRKENSE